jgi:H+/gluconate symporter-like permease
MIIYGVAIGFFFGLTVGAVFGYLLGKINEQTKAPEEIDAEEIFKVIKRGAEEMREFKEQMRFNKAFNEMIFKDRV